MLAYFPRIYADELLYSVLARYHRQTCSLSPKHTLDDLFGCRTVRASVDLPGHLGELSRHLPLDRKLTPSRLAIEFTLFPYYAAFQPAAVSSAVLTALIEGPADSVHVRLGIAASAVSSPKALRFCAVCNSDAMAERGETYWRRAHQLPGVLVCPDHGAPLLESSAVAGPGHQHEFFAATAENCDADAAPPSWMDDEYCRTLLLEIAVRSAALLTMPLGDVTFGRLTGRYRQALIERNLATASGRVEQDRLHLAFDTVFSPLRAILMQVASNGWLSAIVRKHRHVFHPLHHVLFGLFLDRYRSDFGIASGVREARFDPDRGRKTLGDNPVFTSRLRGLVAEGRGLRGIARTLAVDANTVRLHTGRMGLATSWRPRGQRSHATKEAPGPTIRGRWLDIQRLEPELKRTALANRLPAAHAWLYRHDRVWLEAHSPPSSGRSSPGCRMDWQAIDRDLAAALRRAAAELSGLALPVRITLAELERQIKRGGWIGRRRAKLPETAATLAAVTETVEAFQIRRIAWAWNEVEKADPTVPLWKVRRLAGLPDRPPAAVEDALRAVRRAGL